MLSQLFQCYCQTTKGTFSFGKNRSTAIIISKLNQYILSSPRIMTDSWKSYENSKTFIIESISVIELVLTYAKLGEANKKGGP